jgi:dTDP-glucose pyrophosphorylase
MKGIILAGGEGKRLMPLTADRAKPAVPFGGQYRLIDFAISNLLNSGLRQIVVLTRQVDDLHQVLLDLDVDMNVPHGLLAFNQFFGLNDGLETIERMGML